MNKRRIVALLLVLLLVVVSGYSVRTLYLRLSSSEGQGFLESLRPGVDVELTSIRFSETRQGKRKYLLTAASATYSAQGVSLVDQIEVVFFDEGGRETMRLRADAGDLAGSNQSVTLRGNVILTGSQGFEMSTDHLTYDKGQDLLKTDARVVLRSVQGVLRGRGLIAFPQRERLQLLNDVTGEFGTQFIDYKPGHGQG